MENSFLSLDPSEWTDYLAGQNTPKFRSSQVIDWIFKKHVNQPESMTNIGKDLQSKLKDHYEWDLPQIESQIESNDGSTKLLLKAANGDLIESVILRYDTRTSLCVSSQVGCRLACQFCQTGKLGFFRNLSTAEIIAQFFVAQQIAAKEGRRISHIVFMGMGEPLDNYDNVIKACNTFISEAAFNLSARHVTISTSGLSPKIIKLASDTKAALAVSLHAARDELRTELMPINRRYSLENLKEALKIFQRHTSRKITIEYILIKDKNCSQREAKELVRFLHGIRAKVNLIPFNAHPGLPYERPSDINIRAFQKYLAERSYPAPVRYSKGLDVSAACGQLAAKQLNLAAQPKRDTILQARRNLPS